MHQVINPLGASEGAGGWPFGQALYASAPEPKQFLELQGGHNNGFIYMREEWVSALGDFMRRNL